MDKIQIFRSNLDDSGDNRREVYEGHEYLVVPVVMIVEGVLNDALVPEVEFGRYAEAWNGRPVVVEHPVIDGVPVSANQPHILERSSIGQLFDAHTEGGKLKAEAWLNVGKAQRIGYGELVDRVESGEIIEVSTGYFPDIDARAGEFNGEGYNAVHRNIRPDHLAFLLQDEGACSVADGCGTRVNKKQINVGGVVMNVKDALKTIAANIGFRANFERDNTMQNDSLICKAETLKANGKLSAKQFQQLMDMEEDERALMRAFIDAIESAGTANQDPPKDDDEPVNDVADAGAGVGADTGAVAMNTNKNDSKNAGPDIDAIVAQKVDEHVRRRDVVGKLVANDKCPFSEDDMKVMSVDHLEKLEKSIRPADYSGQGGFAANSDAIDSNVRPLVPRPGVVRPKKADNA